MAATAAALAIAEAERALLTRARLELEAVRMLLERVTRRERLKRECERSWSDFGGLSKAIGQPRLLCSLLFVT